ncbi:MAG: M48 family metalloprotease, partial [Bdellovibrionales bacterium]|nr:M48 family metalloprotease [Bdellovibrionales bacterium]
MVLSRKGQFLLAFGLFALLVVSTINKCVADEPLTTSADSSQTNPNSFEDSLIPDGFEQARWEQFSKNILHSLVGDDSYAYLGLNPRFEFPASSKPSAYALAPNRVVLSEGLIKEFKNRSEVAFVIAHELGHIVLKHTGSQHNLIEPSGAWSEMVKREIEADAFAVRLLENSSFDPHKSIDLLGRLSGLEI